jgi:hypothetical protein
MEKWNLLKLFQEWGETGIKENDGGSELGYDILQKFWKCHNIPPVQQYANKKIIKRVYYCHKLINDINKQNAVLQYTYKCMDIDFWWGYKAISVEKG